MAIKVQELLERIKQVDLAGIIKVDSILAGKPKREVVLIEFLRIRAAMKNDEEARISLLVDPCDRDGDLFFIVPNLADCSARDLELTIFMDANARCAFGGHRWKAGEEGTVSFTYALPMPASTDTFPDVALLQRMLSAMYEGFLFPELKQFELAVGNADFLDQDEQRQRISAAFDVYTRLTSPSGVSDAV